MTCRARIVPAAMAAAVAAMAAAVAAMAAAVAAMAAAVAAMAAAVAAMAAAVAAIVAVAPSLAMAQQAGPALDDTQALGRRLFVQSCGVCHTSVQRGAPRYGPVLSRDSLGGQADVMREVIMNGTPRMPGFKHHFEN